MTDFGPTIVVKVGGSLLTLPDLSERIRNALTTRMKSRLVFVVGGGQLVEDLRNRAKATNMDEEFCHWAAMDLMSTTAIQFQAQYSAATLAKSLDLLKQHSQAVLDCHSFVRDQSQLPMTWDTTSDSIAAAVAHWMNAKELCLLKSTTPDCDSIADWSKVGIVDANFPKFANSLGRVSLLNLRDDRSLWIEGRSVRLR